uniref:NB-ARC domain-containing protein n=1 Tax=Leersia perrieri TaxID=77586 RepID=A0A0D9XS92_9ORYZ
MIVHLISLMWNLFDLVQSDRHDKEDEIWKYLSQRIAVSNAVNKLSSILPPTASSEAQQQDLDDFRMLEATMRRIHAALHLHDAGDIREEKSAKLRLEELKELAYDAEEVVEEYEYEVNRRKAVASAGGSSSSKRRRLEVNDEDCSKEAGIVSIPSELAVRTRKVTKRFSEIKGYSDSFTLSVNDGERRIIPDINSVRQTGSFVFAPIIIGREQDKENVIKKVLTGEGSHVSVLAIVGMGGLGKTALAQLVYNDPKVRQTFDLWGWVCVSEHFDVENITRKIISSLTKGNCDYIKSGDLQGKLENLIKEKRVFLVLDDVWNERTDYWESLCTPMLAATRCDIIVTTRSEAVARLVQTTPFYSPNCLNRDDSWSLFKQTAFVEQDNGSPENMVKIANLVDIGRRIAEKCKGLPLALRTLGSVLRFETDVVKWRDVLESELWYLKRSQKEVLAALELSYKYMPIYLKRCFVSLCLYPKDYALEEDDMIRLWQLLDLLHCDGIDDCHEIGSLYYTDLIQRSLLQMNINGFSGVVMHDLVHDLACLLAGREFFRLEGDKETKVPWGARYMSIVPNPSCKTGIQISNASQSLRAIITIRIAVDIKNPEALFSNSKKFRTIDITRHGLRKALFDSLGDMKLLRHLNISEQFNLTLSMEECKLHGIGRLFNLHTVPVIYLMNCGCPFDIRELRSMNEIRNLCMRGLRNVPRIGYANEASLESKKNLQILELDFNASISCDHCNGAYTNEDNINVSGGQLLESLRPHYQSLKVLRIHNLNNRNYPSWLSSSSFAKLTELLLDTCQSQHLPTLGELPSLKSLQISRMDYVKHIGREFCSHDPEVKGFQLLTSLTLEDMSRLSEWSEVLDGEFSSLETLRIFRAFELTTLPLVPFKCLRSVFLMNCTNLVAFPASATLQKLYMIKCNAIKELPFLPSLQSLELTSCPSLVSFGHFPSLTILSLREELKEETLHRLINSHLTLEDLDVSSDSLKSICLDPHSFPSLRKLSLRCPKLRYFDALGSIASLKILQVLTCHELHVPDSLRSHLEELHIS